MRPIPTYDPTPIYREVQLELIKLLHQLSDEDWYASTSSSKWNVRDIVAHLLDGDFRRLSFDRDGHTPPSPPSPIEDYISLVDFLNELNAQWVTASKRLSPRILVELTEYAHNQLISHFNSVDLDAPSLFPVSWAGHNESPLWFDIAREYTEKWHHQQQIREAVNLPLLTEPKWVEPLINTLIHGIPPIYNRLADEVEPTIILIKLSGEYNNEWLLTNMNDQWQLFLPDDEKADLTISLSTTTMWRMLTKSITAEEAIDNFTLDGDPKLGSLIAKTVSFMK